MIIPPEIRAIIYIFSMGMILIALYYRKEIYEYILINHPEAVRFVTWLVSV